MFIISFWKEGQQCRLNRVATIVIICSSEYICTKQRVTKLLLLYRRPTNRTKNRVIVQNKFRLTEKSCLCRNLIISTVRGVGYCSNHDNFDIHWVLKLYQKMYFLKLYYHLIGSHQVSNFQEFKLLLHSRSYKACFARVPLALDITEFQSGYDFAKVHQH